MLHERRGVSLELREVVKGSCVFSRTLIFNKRKAFSLKLYVVLLVTIFFSSCC